MTNAFSFQQHLGRYLANARQARQTLKPAWATAQTLMMVYEKVPLGKLDSAARSRLRMFIDSLDAYRSQLGLLLHLLTAEAPELGLALGDDEGESLFVAYMNILQQSPMLSDETRRTMVLDLAFLPSLVDQDEQLVSTLVKLHNCAHYLLQLHDHLEQLATERNTLGVSPVTPTEQLVHVKAQARQAADRIRYDPATDSLYIRLADLPAVNSEEVAEGLVLDFDAAGALVGLDVQHVTGRTGLTSLSWRCNLKPVTRNAAGLTPAEEDALAKFAARHHSCGGPPTVREADGAGIGLRHLATCPACGAEADITDYGCW